MQQGLTPTWLCPSRLSRCESAHRRAACCKAWTHTLLAMQLLLQETTPKHGACSGVAVPASMWQVHNVVTTSKLAAHRACSCCDNVCQSN